MSRPALGAIHDHQHSISAVQVDRAARTATQSVLHSPAYKRLQGGILLCQASSAVPAGDLIFFIEDNDNQSPGNPGVMVSDNLGNTYTQIGSTGGFCLGGKGDYSTAWYTVSHTAGVPTITATISAAPYSFFLAFAAEYSGTTGIGKYNFTYVSKSTDPSQTITTTNANSLVAAVDASCGVKAPTAGSGWTLHLSFAGSSSSMPIGLEDQAFATTGSKSVTWHDPYNGGHGLWAVELKK